jgi:threonine/homoserine/homoserine lactone efflux protein
MTLLAIASFLGIMLILAAIPSASVALVVARTSSCGLLNGIATITGIVVADLIFVAIAIMGMSALAFTLGSVFSVLKYIGGAYLIWLGVKLIMSKETAVLSPADYRGSTLFSSFAAGLLLTLGDMKAILFYASLFPSLVDVTSLSVSDIAIILTATIITVGGVKLMYAFAARAIVERLRLTSLTRHTKRIAGGLMIGTGGYIITKA